MSAREIEPEFLERLGRIVTQWALIEATEGEIVSQLLDADPGGMYVMTQSVSGQTLTNWIRTLEPIRLTHPSLYVPDVQCSHQEARGQGLR